MTSERAHQVERVYHAALAVQGSAREAVLDEMCAGDDALRQEVVSLLMYEGDAQNFLSERAFDLIARTVPASAGVGRPARAWEGRRSSLVGDLVEHGMNDLPNARGGSTVPA